MKRRRLVKSFQVRIDSAAASAAGSLLLALATMLPAAAQTIQVGSSDDPREVLQEVWWRRDHAVRIMGGASLIGPQWRGATSVGLDYVGRSFTGRFNGTFRLGVLGGYDPDVDETYDLLRLVDFVRYNPPSRSSVHLRLGPLDRVQLGPGHLVNFFNSNVAWDDRTVGVEFGSETRLLSLRAFTDNVLGDGVVGGRIGVNPLVEAADHRVRSFEMGFSYVTDLATWNRDVEPVTAYNVDVSFTPLRSGDLRFSPFATFAWYEHHGNGLGIGADLESPRFLDAARFRLRVALFYNGQEFMPGFFGSFYTVHNPRARILNSVAYLEDERQIRPEGALLDQGFGGNDLASEFRLLIFERFELWYYFRRHYGSQALSEYHLRLFLRAVGRFEIDVGLDRGGLTGFFSLFRKLNDQTALVFNASYLARGNLWVFIQSRYTFENALERDGTTYYLVQRRFEPMAGFRWTF